MSPFAIKNTIKGLILIASSKPMSKDKIRTFYALVTQMATYVSFLKERVSNEKRMSEAMGERLKEGIVMFGGQDDTVFMNPEARKFLGIPPKMKICLPDFLRQFQTKFVDENSIHLEEIIRGLLVGKQSTVLKEFRLMDPKERVIRATFEAVTEDECSHQVIGVLISLWDVTLENQMDRMKTEFVSMVSHELRTPLTIIQEGVSLVLDGLYGPINEDQKKLLTISKDNVQRLHRLISDLLDISRLHADKMVLRLNTFNLLDLAATMTKEFELASSKKGIPISWVQKTKGREPFQITADQDKIHQIFTNLLHNAMKFTESGGKITIELASKKKWVSIMVKDTGQGISNEDIPKLFSKFEQLSQASKSKPEGTGLGLAICKGLIELHNGKIWIDSEFGKGTQVTFTLPKDQV